jgi:hypothetical protein
MLRMKANGNNHNAFMPTISTTKVGMVLESTTKINFEDD